MPAPLDENSQPAPPPMLADIGRQAATLAGVLARRAEIATFAQDGLRPGKNGRTYVFGSGDGWFAARVALAGAPVGSAASGLDFTLNIAPRLGADDRVVAISMSGNVDRTLEGARIAKDHGARLSLLTNGQGGRLGALGALKHSLDITDIAPFLCGTSSYTATLATLQLAFGALGDDDAFADALAALIPELPDFIARADAFTRQMASQIGKATTGARFLGVGASTATADYGAAKFVEVTKIAAWGDDIEEFAHRQYWSMATSEMVVLLPVDKASAGYADASADALADLGVTTVSFEPENAAVPSAKFRLALPGGHLTAGLTQAIALQLLAYHMGIASGTDPNKREHLKNDQVRFSVSRKLTRRSLLGTGQ